MSVHCQHPGENHSTNRVRVHHGAPEPLTLCGYHASRLDGPMFSLIRSTPV